MRRRLAREAKAATAATPAAASEAGFAARRVTLTALGLQVTEDGKSVLCAPAMEQELRLLLERLDAAIGVLGAPDDTAESVAAMEGPSATFGRERTSDNARKLAAAMAVCASKLTAFAPKLLAYADAFDALKSTVERLKSENSPPGSETVAP
jgi:hypothetical protein